MFEEPNDLSPDLEWMLRSGQVDAGTIAEALARKYYQRIYYLMIACLTYPREAHRAAQETFVRATFGFKQFDETRDIYAWLVEIANDICQLRKKHQESHQFLNPRLVDIIKNRKSTARLTPHHIEKAVIEIKSQVKDHHQTQLKRAGSQEFVLLGVALVVAFFLFRITTYFTSPSSNGEDSDSPISIQDVINSNQEGFLKVDANQNNSQSSQWIHGIPPQEPLSKDSTHEDIWRRLLLSRYLWENLWVDVSVVLYGPVDYFGAPLAERHQLWLDQETGGLHLSGPLNGDPDNVERITPTSVGFRPTKFFIGIDDYARLGSQIPWFYLSADLIFTPYMINFFLTAYYDFPPHSLYYQVIDEGEISGRKAVIVDVIDQNGTTLARQWLDSATGIILRENYFSSGPDSSILLETFVTNIEFDVEFSNGYFHKQDQSILELGYLQDFNGTPESSGDKSGHTPDQFFFSQILTPLLKPPPNFDYSQSQLTFTPERDGGESSGQSSTMHVLADSYYLGDIGPVDPSRTLCVRSTFGDKIAVSQWSQSLNSNQNLVKIYTLDDLDHVELSIPDSYVRNLAFSPDDRYIAVSSLDQSDSWWNPWRIYIIDIENGERINIPEYEHIWSLAWSPDGTKLASLRWPGFRNYAQSLLRVYVYDLSSNEIETYLLNSDFTWGSREVKVPLQDWNANFSLTMGRLEPCVYPPERQD